MTVDAEIVKVTKERFNKVAELPWNGFFHNRGYTSDKRVCAILVVVSEPVDNYYEIYAQGIPQPPNKVAPRATMRVPLGEVMQAQFKAMLETIQAEGLINAYDAQALLAQHHELLRDKNGGVPVPTSPDVSPKVATTATTSGTTGTTHVIVTPSKPKGKKKS